MYVFFIIIILIIIIIIKLKIKKMSVDGMESDGRLWMKFRTWTEVDNTTSKAMAL